MATVSVSQLITDANARAIPVEAAVGAFLNELQAAINVAFTTGLPTTYNYASVPEVNFPVIGGGIRPTVTGLGIVGPPEAPTIILATPQDIALPTDDLLAPTHNFEFFEAAYQSTLLDPLKAKLLADLTNGGYGIDTADEQALYQRARDREVENAMMRIDEAGRSMAARGFPLPPDLLQIHTDRAYQELQNKMSGVSREIFVDSAKRFVENRRFTIEQVKSLEQILIGFHNSIQERALNIAKALAEYAITVYNAFLARYRARLEAAKIASDVQLQRVQVDLARAQASLELFKGKIAAYEAQLRLLVEPLRLQVELYRADIEGNRALTDGLLARTSLQQKVLEATIQQNTEISRLTVTNAQTRLQAAVAGAQLALEAAKGGATTSASVLLGILNAVNTLAVQTVEEAA